MNNVKPQHPSKIYESNVVVQWKKKHVHETTHETSSHLFLLAIRLHSKKSVRFRIYKIRSKPIGNKNESCLK